MIKILSCNCRSLFQDKEYGVGNRVHNPGMKDRHLVSWICTVCGNRKSPTSADKEENLIKKVGGF